MSAKAAWFGAPRIEPAKVGGKAGTKLLLTEQGAHFDGHQEGGPSREQGARGLVEMLSEHLDG